jgi:hypothetical protein
LCIIALEKMGEHASSFACELLCALSSDPDVVVRRWAIRTLEHGVRTQHISLLGPECDDQQMASPIEQIAAAVKDKDPVVKQWVLLTLAGLEDVSRNGSEDGHRKVAFQACTQAFHDTEDLSVRCIAVGAAAQFSGSREQARVHFQMIQDAVAAEDKELKRIGALALALYSLGMSKAQGNSKHYDDTATDLKDEIFQLLDKNGGAPEMRRGAAHGMEWLLELSEGDIDVIAGLAGDEEEDISVRLCAIRTLGHRENTEGHAQQVYDVLTSKNDTHPAVTICSLRALPKMGWEGAQLMHQFKKEKESENVKALDRDTWLNKTWIHVTDIWWYISNDIKAKVMECCPCLCVSETPRASPLAPLGRMMSMRYNYRG